jgi:nucleotide-binding universal stress UspA family protein
VADQSARDRGAQDAGLIVVGVDGTAGAEAALDFALDQGWRRGCRVEVVTAWLSSGRLEDAPGSRDLVEGRARVQQMQGELVARCRATSPGALELEQVVVHDYAGRVLVARAVRATMVVVGCGSPSGVSHQPLGSVAEYCVRHSPVPVVIVPPPARLERRTTTTAQAV